MDTNNRPARLSQRLWDFGASTVANLPTEVQELEKIIASSRLTAMGRSRKSSISNLQSTIFNLWLGARVVIMGLAEEQVAEALNLLASGAIRYPKVATTIPMWEGVPVFHRLDENPAAIHKGVLILE